MHSERVLWVDVGSGELTADWRLVIVTFKDGRPDFKIEPRWARDSAGVVRRVGRLSDRGPEGEGGWTS